jgi:hypothetical protein
VNKLVVRQTYINDMAFDTSDNRNHGVPYSVTPGVGPFAPSFEFRLPESRVIVRPSASLQDLIAVRAVATFFLDPPGGLTRRYNLIEGHLTFALFVQPDGSLMGTILDAGGQWNGAQSAPNVVTTGKWHQAELRHDGINQSLILLDGAVIASSYNARGPVRSVGPHGIAVGHWPEDPGVYTMVGYIRGIEVYKYDPAKAAKGLLDSCCIDRGAIDDFADKLRAKGYTADAARQQAMNFLNFGITMSGEVRGADPTVSQQHAHLSEQALAAFVRGDSAAYTTAIAEIAALTTARLSKTQLNELREQEAGLIKDLPLPIKDWQGLIKSLCWADPKIDPQQLASDYTAAAKLFHKAARNKG